MSLNAPRGVELNAVLEKNIMIYSWLKPGPPTDSTLLMIQTLQLWLQQHKKNLSAWQYDSNC